LCLYFITSTVWGMVERMLLKRFAPAARPASESTGAAAVSERAPAPKKPAATEARPSLFGDFKKKLQELQELADKPTEASRDGDRRKGRKSR
jgi:hypothetical protein